MLKRGSVLFKICMVCFACYAAYTLATLGMALSSKQQEIKTLRSQLQEQQIQNEELNDMVENGATEEYMEKIAREKLDLVNPNDRVFVNPQS